MRVLVFVDYNPVPTEMDYPGEPAKGHQIYLGTEMLEIDSVLPLEKKEDGDPEFKVLVHRSDRRPPTPQQVDVKTFLHSLGPLLASMSPEQILSGFYEELVKNGKIVH